MSQRHEAEDLLRHRHGPHPAARPQLLRVQERQLVRGLEAAGAILGVPINVPGYIHEVSRSLYE